MPMKSVCLLLICLPVFACGRAQQRIAPVDNSPGQTIAAPVFSETIVFPPVQAFESERLRAEPAVCPQWTK